MISGASIESATGAFNESRPRLFGIAYRMLGSVAEAEDIVQEAWVRWQQTDRTVVRNPAGFVTTVTTRLALNTADSARVRREEYVGPWLPEPVDTSADPSLGAERAEALDSAVLVLLEKLRPDQRAAYVLREAFDYSYDQIGEILATSAVNARQLVSRAKKHVRSHRKEAVDPQTHRSLLAAFVAAAQDGDLERLEQVLSADVVSTSDGAGIAPRAAAPSSAATTSPGWSPGSRRIGGPVPLSPGSRPTARPPCSFDANGRRSPSSAWRRRRPASTSSCGSWHPASSRT